MFPVYSTRLVVMWMFYFTIFICSYNRFQISGKMTDKIFIEKVLNTYCLYLIQLKILLSLGSYLIFFNRFTRTYQISLSEFHTQKHVKYDGLIFILYIWCAWVNEKPYSREFVISKEVYKFERSLYFCFSVFR